VRRWTDATPNTVLTYTVDSGGFPRYETNMEPDRIAYNLLWGAYDMAVRNGISWGDLMVRMLGNYRAAIEAGIPLQGGGNHENE